MDEETKGILSKQNELISHQKNFNWILAFLTTFLVLFYSTEKAWLFSRFYSIILFIMATFASLSIIVLFYLVRKEFKKLLNKKFLIYLAIVILGILLLFLIDYLQKGTFISFDGWRFK
jgi:magnesium-transporting ATPase (P-type)